MLSPIVITTKVEGDYFNSRERTEIDERGSKNAVVIVAGDEVELSLAKVLISGVVAVFFALVQKVIDPLSADTLIPVGIGVKLKRQRTK